MATSNARYPILVVAALERELARLKKNTPTGAVLLETGEGVANAERSLDAQLEQLTARAVLSIGFAGALSRSLQAGDLVIARQITGGLAQPDPALLSAAARVQIESPVRLGIAVTRDEILWRAAQKRALSQVLAPNDIGFIDMESTAIAGVCARRGVPFVVIRSITDLLEEDLPLDFNLYRDSGGRVDSARVATAAMLKPRALAGLLALRSRSELCAERLAEFVRSLVPALAEFP
jgi:adenosylhomocysteine nucleosidase